MTIKQRINTELFKYHKWMNSWRTDSCFDISPTGKRVHPKYKVSEQKTRHTESVISRIIKIAQEGTQNVRATKKKVMP